MKQQDFEEKHINFWRQLDKVIGDRKEKPNRDFPALYRKACQHLAVAKSRRYTNNLIDRLNNIVAESHHILYANKSISEQRWLLFLSFDFPNAIKRNARFVTIAALLFFIPLGLMGYGSYINDEFIYSIADSASVAMYEQMYNPENRNIGRERDSASDIMMFGHYIQNNISIGFRTFATGLLMGLGSVFFLVFNGIQIGGIAGYLTEMGFTETFYGFIAGHAAFELTAIVFCGAAGLKVGFSLIDPGPYTRLESLKRSSRDAVLIVYGSAIMLLIAAFIEAFWSSMAEISLSIKITVGIINALLLLAYFVVCGRTHEP